MCALPMTDEKIYTVKEVAAILRVTPRTVRTMIAQREIDAFVVRDEYRIKASELERFMRESKQMQEPEACI